MPSPVKLLALCTQTAQDDWDMASPLLQPRTPSATTATRALATTSNGPPGRRETSTRSIPATPRIPQYTDDADGNTMVPSPGREAEIETALQTCYPRRRHVMQYKRQEQADVERSSEDGGDDGDGDDKKNGIVCMGKWERVLGGVWACVLGKVRAGREMKRRDGIGSGIGVELEFEFDDDATVIGEGGDGEEDWREMGLL
ncbi:hypothetical protein BDV95DRAFT_368081 [Massariosphaeria phaeospora]|uniref:Uncharacterized protein n=1 Tax=Massariosphaeria phaeospora TaxID=100035 RepID=A0A7C8I845_9PLEO|nr:hypothetical protein BDV95DRAFT_368081 [Massariosphaeria phaeospora]